jgi:hypothetical protein
MVQARLRRTRDMLTTRRSLAILQYYPGGRAAASHAQCWCNARVFSSRRIRNTYPQAFQPESKERASIARISHAVDVALPTKRRRVVTCIHAESRVLAIRKHGRCFDADIMLWQLLQPLYFVLCPEHEEGDLSTDSPPKSRSQPRLIPLKGTMGDEYGSSGIEDDGLQVG